MTRERAKELAPIIQAYGDGKDIEYRCVSGDSRFYIVEVINLECPGTYRIKPTPSLRPMTRGEVLYMVTTTPGMVVREIGGSGEMFIPGRMAQNEYVRYEYAIIDKHGNPGEWKRFEVEE